MSLVSPGPPDILPPGSVARRVDREMFLLLGGAAALLLQVAHPLVAAGVDQHSDFRRDPIGRLHRTLDTTLAVVFGTPQQARRALARINERHVSVRGRSAGGAYDARDPALLHWVQTTLVLTSLRLYELVMGPLAAEDREAYWAETIPIASALGIPRSMLPTTIAALERYEREALARDVIPNATSREVGRAVLRPFRRIPDAAYWPSDVLAAGLLPPGLRSAFGLRWRTRERLAFRALVVAVRVLRRVLPAWLTVVPQARRYERRR
ncbi:MAG TPA: oxygenase MpaB family protein [Candidatus Limnocylindrales bacterium]|nr:oxygenase MpaB family protein [Candidatus Limnocylindrales bacterium]